MERVILKISGEALGGIKKVGIDPVTVNEIASEIKEAKDTSDVEIGIVVGGGNFFRGRDAESLGMDRVSCDYMGMTGTILNAMALKNALLKINVKTEILTCLELPQALTTYTKKEAIKYLEDGYVVIYAGGTGRPYFSTDTATLMRAVDTNASTVLMAKNGVDGVYDKDPNVDKTAKKYDILTHRDILLNNLGVMDLTAATIANDNNINIRVFDMNAKGAVKDALLGKNIGTIIKKEI